MAEQNQENADPSQKEASGGKSERSESGESKSGDFKSDTSGIANVGKRFYTWATLGSFAGVTFLVSSTWEILKDLKPGELVFVNNGWPLAISFIVLFGFALATEPESQTTTNAQKIQKLFITCANALLVYFSVLGASAALGS